MPEPKPQKIERRPDHIPANWLTRQQAQIDLNLRSPYGLKKLLDAMQPTPADFEVVGKTGYLSLQLIERMRLQLSEVLDIRNLSGYLNGEEAAEAIGCAYQTFSGLVLEYPPSVQTKEVVLARNNNSQVFPHYSVAYVDSLKQYYEPPKPNIHGVVEDRPDTNRPSKPVDLVSKINARIASTPEAVLVNPDQAERQTLLSRVTTVQNALEDVVRFHQSDRQFGQLRQQLSAAATALRGTDPMPQGIERLFEQAQRFIKPDDED